MRHYYAGAQMGRHFKRAVHELFVAQASQTPIAIAIDGPGGSLTYSKLDRRSAVLAGGLLAAGVKPRDIVVIALDRNANVLVAYLAILKVGAAYCSLDLADPPARHQWTLEDSRPSALITTREIDQVLPANTIQRLYIDELTDRSYPPAKPLEVDVNDPACVMYTSGSTGRPKAALIPHRGIVRLFAEDTFVLFGPDLRMLAHSPMHFDAITYEAWGPLLHGGTTVPFAGGLVPSLREIREHISRYRVNTLFFGPQLFNIIVDEDVHLLDGIRTMMIGGDAVSASHVRKAQAALPETRFINAYGPTEATTFATMYAIPRPFSPEAASVPIGTPITLTSCYILSDQLQPVPDGEEGELFIGGDGVALGYLNLPEATTQRFLSDRFSAEPGALMYRTGDLCRRLPDGDIDFLGRADGQVKIGGRRIEPGEIEASVLRYPGVLQCVVLIHEVNAQKHILCYYVAERAAGDISQNALREYLKERLPSYLVPRDLIAVAAIPRKPSGKIDRRALPLPPRRALAEAVGHARSAEEELLVELWKQSLEEADVAPCTCFYAAGGTSLGAVRLCCAIERETGRFIDIGELAVHSTPRKLAARLFGTGDHQPPSVVPLNSGPVAATIFFLSGHVWNPNSLRQIAAHLQDTSAVVSISPPPLSEATDVLRDAGATARYALKQIRAHQARGPYHLFGYSYGGILAMEVARALRAAGEVIGTLVLLDSHLPADGIYKPAWRRAFVHARQIARGGPGLLSKRLRERSRRLSAPAGPAAQHQKAGRLFDEAERACTRAFLTYRAEPYSGDVLLLRASKLLDHLQFTKELPMGGWPGVVTGRLTLETIPGDHASILKDPDAGAVAQRLRAIASSPADKS
jgi:amino acid adenylation domain-containing protein